MAARRRHGDKVYGTYEPYPVSRGSEARDYHSDTEHTEEEPALQHAAEPGEDQLPDLLGDAGPTDWSLPRPLESEPRDGLRPLSILQSLFADRVGLLRAALEELQGAE